MYLGPLVFDELFKAKPWGGRALARVAGKRLPPKERIGESWELADHPHGMSVVREGPLTGKTLRSLMREHGSSLLGRRAGKRRFPLLIKLLDARQRLSVQVHPDDACARSMRLKDSGKTESWYVLDVRKDGAIIAGLKSVRDAAEGELRQLAQTGALAERLRVLHPTQGHALLCPAGAVHALGPGVVLLEIQQNSDSTFRLYDWGRMGLDGKPRPLHLTKAIRAVGGKVIAIRRQRSRALQGLPFSGERLIACDKFVVDRWRVRKPTLRPKSRRFEILHVIKGSGRLLDARWTPVRLSRGATVLVPACVSDYRVVPSRALTLVRAAEPE